MTTEETASSTIDLAEGAPPTRRNSWAARLFDKHPVALAIAFAAALAALVTCALIAWEAGTASPPPRSLPASAVPRPGSCLVDNGQCLPSLDAFNDQQILNGKRIIAAGLRDHVSKTGIIAALTAAMRDSKLSNYANSNVQESLTYPYDSIGADGHSVGVFGQTGDVATLADRMNPTRSAQRFYSSLKAIADWELMTPGQIAQEVQRSAFTNGYAAEVPRAKAFYLQYVDTVREVVCQPGSPQEPSCATSGPSVERWEGSPGVAAGR